jgi:hypothetical protein
VIDIELCLIAHAKLDRIKLQLIKQWRPWRSQPQKCRSILYWIGQDICEVNRVANTFMRARRSAIEKNSFALTLQHHVPLQQAIAQFFCDERVVPPRLN